jgi:hypothetical protein
LAVGVGLTGIITYAYFLIASHTLSKPDYGFRPGGSRDASR